MPFIPGHGLGRKPQHVPFPRLLATGVSVTTFEINRRLALPYQYRPRYDQGQEGACVGFAWSWAMSILNRRFYDAPKLYRAAQLIDPWPETPPDEGTSTVAGAEILRDRGHWRFARGFTWPLALFEGIETFRSARDIDEMREAITLGLPVVLGINWYDDFDAPAWVDVGAGGPRWWIGRSTRLGSVRGGHAICCFGARDDINAFALVNSWGLDYPVVNIPYGTVQRLLNEEGDAIVPLDRI